MNTSSIPTSMGLRALLPAIALCSVMPLPATAQTLAPEEIDREAGRRMDSLTRELSLMAERVIVGAHPEEVRELRRKWRALLPEVDAKEIAPVGNGRRSPLAMRIDSLIIAARTLARRHPELSAHLDEAIPAMIVEVTTWQLAQLRAGDMGRRGSSNDLEDDRRAEAIVRLHMLIENPHQLRLLARMTRRRLLPALVLDSTALENDSTEYLIMTIDDLPDDDPGRDSVRTMLEHDMVRWQEEYWTPKLARYTERINAVLSPDDRARLDTLRSRMAPLIDIGEEEGEADPIITATRKIAARNRRKLNGLRDSVLRDITMFNRSYPEQVALMLDQLHETLDEEVIGVIYHEMDVVAEMACRGMRANLRGLEKDYSDIIEPAILLLAPHKLLRSGVLSPLTRLINTMEGRE